MARTLYVDALDAHLEGRMAAVARSRDWELLRELARLAHEDAPVVLSSTDAALYTAWRSAVTKYHLKGWTHMTPERVDAVSESSGKGKRESRLKPLSRPAAMLRRSRVKPRISETRNRCLPPGAGTL